LETGPKFVLNLKYLGVTFSFGTVGPIYIFLWIDCLWNEISHIYSAQHSRCLFVPEDGNGSSFRDTLVNFCILNFG